MKVILEAHKRKNKNNEILRTFYIIYVDDEPVLQTEDFLHAMQAFVNRCAY